MSERVVEKIAKAIARTVPVQGSRWNDGHGHDFPREYHEEEKLNIRGIARDAVRTMRDCAPTPEMRAWLDAELNA